jgi:transposase InsO family protein
MMQQRSFPSVEWLCGYFEKSRQAYYQILRRKDRRGIDEELVVNYVQEYRREMHRLGTRKLHHLLQPQLEASGIKCGRDRLFSLLGRKGLLIRRRRAYRSITQRIATSGHFPNLVKDMVIDAPELVWASDTTALAVRDGLGYLTLMTDVYSKRIMGYHAQRTKARSGSLETLRMGLSKREYPERQMIHHSDGGGEYFNSDYLGELVTAHVIASCTAPSSPQENSVAERINGILKEEFLENEDSRTFEDILKKLPEAIRIYNECRPHASLDYMTPIQAHRCNGALRRRWKSYRKTHKKDVQDNHIGKQIHQIMNSWDRKREYQNNQIL